MSPNAFIGQAKKPTDGELTVTLGPAKVVWDRLLVELAQDCGANVLEWNCYSLKAGWSLRVKRKARTIVWLGPRAGSFVAAFILGDKAMRAARANKLPQRIVKILNQAPKYPEGTGVRISMKTSNDLAAVRTLAAIKVAN